MPNDAIADIDHLVCMVPSLERAADGLKTLGFTVTPVSMITRLGLANQLVLMQPRTAGVANFIEVMQVVDATRVPEVMQPLVAAHGPRWLVLSGRSAPEARRRFLECGLEFPPPVHVEREWALPGGEVLNVVFDVLLPIEGSIAFNYCSYLTLNHYLRPDLTAHPNSAVRLAGILGKATGARDAVERWAGVFECESYREGPLWCATPGRIPLKVAEADPGSSAVGQGRSAPRTGQVSLAACEIEVASLRRVADLLRQAGVEYAAQPDAIHVQLDSMPGLEIRFREPVRFQPDTSLSE